MRFQDRIAIVTGGSQGIGACIAERLAQEGAIVRVLASHDIVKAEVVVETIHKAGGRATAGVADVRDPDALQRIAAEVMAAHGAIDILVNSAGVFYPTPVGASSLADIDTLVDINLKGPFHAISAVAPHMKAAGRGKIVNIASVCAVMGFKGYSLYCGAKAGVAMMTRTMALELAPHGINVNSIAPGNTATPMNLAVRTAPEFAEMLADMTARTPSGRTYSEADEMASLALFLLSEETRAMHGSTLLMDEGLSAGV